MPSRFPSVGDVRGIGLATGVEFVTDPTSREPNPLLAGRVKEGLRNRGVLVGTTARANNCLKIRPPLAFTLEEAPVFLQSMEATLTEVAER